VAPQAVANMLAACQVVCERGESADEGREAVRRLMAEAALPQAG